ncbi:MAG: hypothetical protein CMM80_04620 [Rhodospirillaceae bacterium]|nr:hypothetical protein [Rhodospirillaceae bacterium]
MSKIMATSGNQAQVLKGTATGEDATANAGAVGLFAALFGGIQEAETEDGAEPTQSNLQAGDTNSNYEPSLDPHMAAMLGTLKKSVPDQVNAALIPNASDDVQTDNFELQTDNFEPEADKTPDAGLLAADNQISKSGQHLASQIHLQNQSQMASLAEDMKQANPKTSAAQFQQPTDLDEDFIGPPLPRVIQKSASAAPERSDISPKKVKTTAHQTVLLQNDMPQRSVLKADVLDSAPLGKLGDELAVIDALDAASLKAERMPELAGRLAERPARVVAPSVQLSSSTADAQTSPSAAIQQTSFTQTGGQHSGSGSAFTGTTQADLPEQWLDSLDMQNEKWTEQLVRRIDREFRRGGKGLEFELNPRNLGRLKVTLSVAQEQTNVVLRAETGAAAQLLMEAEGRLAQMLGDAGLKLGQFDAYTGGQSRGFGQQDKHQEQNSTLAEAENDSRAGDTDTSDGLINLKA